MTERVRPKNLKPEGKPVRAPEAKTKDIPFTETKVLKLKAKAKQYLAWDKGTGAAKGLAILVSPRGTKSYRCVFYYVGDTKPHYKNLGRVGETSLEEARERTRKARADARQGIDPSADDPRRSDEFASAVDTYIRLYQIGSEGNKSAAKTKNVMLNSCPELWRARPVGTIRPQEIEDLLALIRDGDDKELKPRRYLSLRVHAHLKDFFGWCARRKMIKVSPMADMKRPWSGAKPRDRDWFKKEVADNAIISLWRLTPAQIGEVEARYLKLMLLTGKRKTALADMLWQEIDRDWFWDAPASDSENKNLYGVPLPKLARKVLGPRQSQGKVFGEMPEAVLERLKRKIKKLSCVHDFFYHGVRHLVETKMAELRDKKARSLIPPYLRDMLLDHAPQRGSGKGYDHHDYIPEMREAMETWADYIERVVDTKVVPFPVAQSEATR